MSRMVLAALGEDVEAVAVGQADVGQHQRNGVLFDLPAGVGLAGGGDT